MVNSGVETGGTHNGQHDANTPANRNKQGQAGYCRLSRAVLSCAFPACPTLSVTRVSASDLWQGEWQGECQGPELGCKARTDSDSRSARQ